MFKLLKNKILLIILNLLVFTLPVMTLAKGVGCPGPTYGVGVEIGHDKPFPDLMPPDDEYGSDNDPSEWSFSEIPKNVPITAHCYPNNNLSGVIDVMIPRNIQKCRMENKYFWCE
jgi:hypothetical protein